MIGGAWLLRDSSGDMVFHAREAFLSSSSRMEAHFQVMEWVLQILWDLHIQEVEVWCDFSGIVDALRDGRRWPRYRSLIDRINRHIGLFLNLSFRVFHFKVKSLARDIAGSITRNGRLRSYLSISGLAWLHSRIWDESR